MIEALRARLMALAAAGQTITYGDLARDLALPSPAIQTLAALLEDLMQQDAAAGRPFLAALCAGRLGDGLPALGFFELAAELDPQANPDPTTYVTTQRAALRAMYGKV